MIGRFPPLALPPLALPLLALPLLAGIAGAQKDDVAPPYEPHEVLDVRIRMNPGDWRDLRIQHRSADFDEIAVSTYTYFKADVTIDGKEIGSVGVRKKGFFGSVVSNRPSLKIRFDKYVEKQRFHGLDQLTLNNNVQDPSQLHQYLAYRFFRKAGVAAPRCNFAVVRVNGEKLGVYSNVESIRKPFLRRVFKTAKGDLYEGYAGDFVASENSFVRILHKGRDPNARRAHLERLRDALAESPASLPEIAELVDLDAFLRFWAAEVLIAHWDSYSGNRNNYYAFRDAASKRFHFIPWGADSVFWDPGPFIRQRVPKSVKAMGHLCRRLWELPGVRKRYQAEMKRLLDDVFVEKEILAEIDEVGKLLAPHMTLGARSVRASRDRIRAFIKARRAQVEPELANPDIAWPDVPLMATPSEPPRMMELRGEFATTMRRSAEAPGKASFSVTVDGEELTFTGCAAIALPEQPQFIRPGYPTIHLFGKHPKSKQQWHVTFYVDPIRLELEKPKLTVDHFCVWAVVFAGDPRSPTAKRQIFGASGTLNVAELERKNGGAVTGSFAIEVPAFAK